MEIELSAYRFQRIHRAYIIALEYIESQHRTAGNHQRTFISQPGNYFILTMRPDFPHKVFAQRRNLYICLPQALAEDAF